MLQQINVWFEKEFNLSTFSLTNYTEKNFLSLLGSLVCSTAAFLLGSAAALCAVFVGLPLAALGCLDLMSGLLMASFTCFLYVFKVLYEIVAKLIDFLAIPANLFRQEKFVFGEFVQAVTDAVKNLCNRTTTATANPVAQAPGTTP